MKRFTFAAAALLVGMSLSAQLRFGNAPERNNTMSDLERNLQKLVMAGVMINNFYVDSVVQTGWKVHFYNGDYYYVAAYNKIVKGERMYLDYKVLGDLDLREGWYEFDSDGKLILE